MPSLCYYDGKFAPYDGATVSGHDRGFNFGDGVYEVIRVYGGVAHALEAHLARLERSARGIEMDLGHTLAEYTELVYELVRRSGMTECMIYGQVSRGAMERDHFYHDHIKPSDFWFVRALDTHKIRTKIQDGYNLITLEDTRWAHCDIKSLSLLANVIAKNKARKAGAQEAMFFRAENRLVTEGGASNLYAVKDGAIYTAPKGNKILPGIIREYIVMLAQSLNIPLIEQEMPVEFFMKADEVVASSSTMEIMPVRRIDGQPLARHHEKGHGPVFQQIFDAFLDDVASVCGMKLAVANG